MSLSWGILATGRIAHTFAKGLIASKTGKLAAVGSRALDKAQAFAATYTSPEHPVKAHGSYEALLADPAVQAVYISTPHPQHAEWAIAAAEAGKHILCEKPVAMNHQETAAIFNAVRAHDVFAMEAFMYRCHPQTQRVVELIRDGAIGEVKVIQATFSFRTEAGLESRLIDPALGGGGILDVGCYCTSMARLVAGAALGQSFADPLEVQGMAHLEKGSGVDAYALALLKFPNDILAHLATGLRLTQDNGVRLFGTGGSIHIPQPWTPGESVQIFLHRSGKPDPERIDIQCTHPLYALEADAVAAHLAARQCPAMSWDDSLGNMWTLDQWRNAIGLRYAADRETSCGCI